MKLGPVTKYYKRNKVTPKKYSMTSCRKFVTSLLFFRFMAELEQSGSQIPDAQSAKLTISLIVIFYLTKTEKQN